MTIFTALAFAAFIAWFLVKPHLSEARVGSPELNSTLQAALEQRERCLQVLKDLELDYHTNKIADSDYQQMKLTLSQELASLFQTIDGLQKPGH